ncbi:MAG TPA: ATPase, T2SS/T4P/T4SS family [Syntrophomonadaceae bacterium]|nr:ATPase, T2SS/T4P/T4SS family [Syntrophomonadaceae bacterium]
MAVQKRLTGEIMVQMGVISQEQLVAALDEQKRTKEKLGRILVQRGILTEQQLIETLEFMLGIPHVQMSQVEVDPELVKIVPVHLVRIHKVLPVARRKNTLTLAMSDPLNHQAIEDIQMATGLNVIPVLAGENDLDIAIRQYLAFRMDPSMEKILGELNQENKVTVKRELQPVKVADDAPIIRMVNSILVQAVQGRASDVHIEPQEEEMRVRFRIDGELYAVLTIPQLSQAAVVSRLKIMAGMDIAEKRVPQDGRFRMEVDMRDVDFRVSTLPTSYGEKVVLRILDRANALTRVEQLGLSARNKETMLTLARRPYGMVLVTGPTGSGKTTSLYAVLNEVNSIDKNIITLEDPIEYILPGINQVQANSRAGLTFASGLRSILRQDPDIIMVGEIRDQETAELAVQAALTGHLVFSTLHTNSAAGAIARLNDMGIEDFLVGSSLAAIVAQRLVRHLCPNCREKYILDEETAVRLGIKEHSGKEFFRPNGCNMCRQLGYQSRLAIHEILVVGGAVRRLINKGEHSEAIIEEAAAKEGFIRIKEDGINKAKQGLTSLEEVMKAVLLGG